MSADLLRLVFCWGGSEAKSGPGPGPRKPRDAEERPGARSNPNLSEGRLQVSFFQNLHSNNWYEGNAKLLRCG